VVAATSLAAKEYALGVTEGGGRIIHLEEVEEARLFIANARQEAPGLPDAVRGTAAAELAAIAGLLERLAPPDEVEQRVDALTRTIAAAAGGTLDPTPRRRPSLARGRWVFEQRCAACHGETGAGDGPQARYMAGPPPANFTDPAVIGGAALVDVYRRISLGVPGTAMPAFEGLLRDDDRWAVAAYVATLPYEGSLVAATFAAVRRQVDSAVARRSERDAFEAYLTFEQVEAELRVSEPGLARALEAEFATLRARAITADSAAIDSVRTRLVAGLARAEKAVSDRPSAPALFAQSFLLLLREGFEAILILAALLAFLTKAGAPERRRHVTHGAFGALVASAVTWVLVERLFEASAAQREALEGATMLLATAVLFGVSYWLLSKVDVARWTAFMKDRVAGALRSGSGFALASVAFLAVYREGLETILFYQALFAAAGSGAVAVAAGMVAGGVALVALYVGIHRFGLRIPMRPFFAVTSAVLYYMAFVFAGKGIAELQAAGLVAVSPVEWAPRVPALGIFPTLQSLSLQAVLLVAAGVAVVWALRRPAPAPERV
jgi:high-affinity iron transporter